MKKFVIVAMLVMFVSSILVSGCGHFKPAPGQIKKHAQASEPGTAGT